MQSGEHLSEKKEVLIVCFDDANYLLSGDRLNTLVYLLLRLHDEHPRGPGRRDPPDQ